MLVLGAAVVNGWGAEPDSALVGHESPVRFPRPWQRVRGANYMMFR